MTPLIPMEMTGNVVQIVLYFLTAMGVLLGYMMSIRAGGSYQRPVMANHNRPLIAEG
jgi:hypothetical protein